MKTKKILSLLLSMAIICTMFTAFSITASAEGTAIEVKTFTELKTAITNATDPIVIDVVADITGGTRIDVDNGKNITINLNSHTVQCLFGSVAETPSTLTIYGSGTIKGADAESGDKCVDFRRGSTLIADNVKFIGGDATAENGMGGYGLFIVDSTVSLTNCYVSGGKSTGTADNMSAINSSDDSIVYAKNCTFVRGSGGSGINYKTVFGILYDLDSKAKIEIEDIYKSPIVIGLGYQNKVSGNVITNADGSPVIADTPITATTTIPAPTYTVMIPETVSFGDQKQALEKYRNETNDQFGNAVVVSKDFTVSATGVANLFNDLDDGKADYIHVTATFESTLKGTKNTANTVPYTLSQNSTTLLTGAKIATFYNDVDLASKGETNSTTATITMNRADIKNADSYQGTMTFTIAVADRT